MGAINCSRVRGVLTMGVRGIVNFTVYPTSCALTWHSLSSLDIFLMVFIVSVVSRYGYAANSSEASLIRMTREVLQLGVNKGLATLVAKLKTAGRHNQCLISLCCMLLVNVCSASCLRHCQKRKAMRWLYIVCLS